MGRPGVSGAVFDEVQRWSELGLGIAGLATGYTRSRLVDHDPVERTAEEITLADLLAALPGATATLATTLQGALFDVVADLEHRINEASAAASRMPLTGRWIRALHEWLTSLDQQFRDQQSQRAEQAAQFLATVGPETTAELLARVDMNMVLSEVDMDLLVQRVTLEKVLEKVDMNALMADVLADLDTANLTGALASNTVGSIRTLPGAATRIAGRVVRRPTT